MVLGCEEGEASRVTRRFYLEEWGGEERGETGGSE